MTRSVPAWQRKPCREKDKAKENRHKRMGMSVWYSGRDGVNKQQSEKARGPHPHQEPLGRAASPTTVVAPFKEPGLYCVAVS